MQLPKDKRTIVVGKSVGFYYVWIADGTPLGKYVDKDGSLRNTAAPYESELKAQQALRPFRRRHRR